MRSVLLKACVDSRQLFRQAYSNCSLVYICLKFVLLSIDLVGYKTIVLTNDATNVKII